MSIHIHTHVDTCNNECKHTHTYKDNYENTETHTHTHALCLPYLTQLHSITSSWLLQCLFISLSHSTPHSTLLNNPQHPTPHRSSFLFTSHHSISLYTTPPHITLIPSLGVVCLVGHLALSGQAPIPNVYDPTWIAQHGHLYRFSYLYLALMGERLKYYFAWKV